MKYLILASLFTVSFAYATGPAPSPTPGNPNASRKLEFDEQTVNALDVDYNKLDTTSIHDKQGPQTRLYPIRKDFKPEQNLSIKNWGIDQ